MTPSRGATMNRRRAELARGGLLLVVLSYVGLLFVAPVAAIVWGAFGDGLGPFFRALARSDALHALWLSLVMTGIAAVVNAIFGTVVAYVLTRDRFFGRSLLNALVDLPFAISPVIIGFALILLFGRGGWFSPLLSQMGMRVVFSWPAMALATVFVSLPFVIREVGLVLGAVGQEQEQAAYTLGASPLRTFFLVTLPSIRWGLIYGVLLTAARSLGEFGALLVVSGGIARATETGTLFVFRSLDDRRDLDAYAMSVALASLSVALLFGMDILKRRRQIVEDR
jgi:sulfate transport system permease protein